MFNKVILIDVIPGTGKPAKNKRDKKEIIDFFNIIADNKSAIKNDLSYTRPYILDTLTPLY